MLNIELNDFKSVYELGLIIGSSGIESIYKSPLVDRETKQLIKSFKKYAESDTYTLNEFNDGNNVFEVYLELSESSNYISAVLEGKVVRTGWGVGEYDLLDYFKNNTASLESIIKDVETKFKYRFLDLNI